MRFGPHIKALHSSISLYFFNIEKISAKTCLKLMQPKTRPLFGFTCTVMQVRCHIYLPKSVPSSWKLVKTQNSASCPPLHQNWPGKKRQQRCNSEGLLDPQQWEMRSQPVLAALKCCSHSVSAAKEYAYPSIRRLLGWGKSLSLSSLGPGKKLYFLTNIFIIVFSVKQLKIRGERKGEHVKDQITVLLTLF